MIKDIIVWLINNMNVIAPIVLGAIIISQNEYINYLKDKLNENEETEEK